MNAYERYKYKWTENSENYAETTFMNSYLATK